MIDLYSRDPAYLGERMVLAREKGYFSFSHINLERRISLKKKNWLSRDQLQKEAILYMYPKNKDD